MDPQFHPREGQLNFVPIANHLVGSEVLKMLREEEGMVQMNSPAQQWPHQQQPGGRQALSFMTKCARTGDAKKVVWPPAEEGHITTDPAAHAAQSAQPQLLQQQQPQPTPARQQPSTTSAQPQEGAPPPVPPRPANYPQVGSMDQQMMSSQHHTSSSTSSSSSFSSSETKVMKQSHQVQQQSGFQQILPANHQQQFIQQSSNSQQLDSSREYQIPIQMASSQQQIQQQQQQAFNKQEYQVPIQMAPPQNNAQSVTGSSTGSNQGVVDGSIGQFQSMDQCRPPVAVAAANYQNTLQQQKDNQAFETAPHLRKPEASSQANSFPTQWPPQDQNEPEDIVTSHPAGFKLKAEMPIEQPTVKVVPSQPAFKVSRPIQSSGDNKWPPKSGEIVEQPQQTEVRELIKPKKQNRDYTEFFAQNALPTSYTSYRAPPGTQHRGDNQGEDGVTNM